MPKPKLQQGFDVAGTQYLQHEDAMASLEQCFRDYTTSVPSRNFTKRTNGNSVTIYCHCHDQGLGNPTRRANYVDAANKALDRFVQGLKRRHRDIGAGVLDLKESKGSRGYDLQKVSLNDRWELVVRRTYEVSLVSVPGS
jgi:hypothetical protein